MLFVLAEARILQVVCAHFSETKRLVKFPLGQQPGVGCDLATQELELQAAVKTDSQIVVFCVTHGVPLSHWHETRQIPCFQRVGANCMPKSGNSSGKCGFIGSSQTLRVAGKASFGFLLCVYTICRKDLFAPGGSRGSPALWRWYGGITSTRTRSVL